MRKPATRQKSLRIPSSIIEGVEALAVENGTDFSAAANQLLDEAIRMRRCPGIVYTSGPGGRRATLAGTGLDVWEIVATHRSVGCDERRLRKVYHWLGEPQLRVALVYYGLYRDEIDARIACDDAWTPEEVYRRHPALAAAWGHGRRARSS